MPGVRSVSYPRGVPMLEQAALGAHLFSLLRFPSIVIDGGPYVLKRIL